MPQPPAPPNAKKKRQRLILIGGGAALLLLFLYMRSRSAAGTPNATSQTDLQTAAQNAALQQQAQDAAQYQGSSFGGAGAQQSTDLTPVTSGLSTIDTDLQNLPDIIATTIASQTSAAQAPAPTTSPSAPAPITINVGPAAQPVPTGGGGDAAARGVRTSTLTAAQKAAGIIAAPFGPTKPTAAPRGYTPVGLGSGNWGYRRTPTASTKRKGP
jgi:hypothetical protein